jgi:hypothetical protein
MESNSSTPAGMSPTPSMSSSMPPSMSPPPLVTRPPRPKLSVKGTRLTASTLLLIATILLAVSMGVSWWGASISGGGRGSVIGFEPGASYTVQGGFNGTTQFAYISAGLVHVGQLYEAVLGIGIVAAVAGLISALLSYLGAFSMFRSRKVLPFSMVITLISLACAAALPSIVALGQPGAFKADNTAGFGSSSCGASPNPCSDFWGSTTAGGTTLSWGADVGWYLAIAATVLLLIALLQLWSVRKQPYTRDEVRASLAYGAAVSGAPGMATGAPGSSPSPLWSEGGPTTQAAPRCPRCGNPLTYVAQYSRWYCVTERIYP